MDTWDYCTKLYSSTIYEFVITAKFWLYIPTEIIVRNL